MLSFQMVDSGLYLLQSRHVEKANDFESLPPETGADINDWQMNLSRNKVSSMREVCSVETTRNVSEMMRS